jgi:hypothetical protein
MRWGDLAWPLDASSLHSGLRPSLRELGLDVHVHVPRGFTFALTSRM